MYKLLIADDEQLERNAIEHILKASTLPLIILKAKNGREAVEIAQSTPFDIALLDIKMPGISGLEAAKRIKEINSRCKIIFLSAMNTFDFAQEAIRSGARDYLVKPISSKELLSLLHTLLEELQDQLKVAPQDKLKNMLTQFNRTFFAAIKYGNVSYDAMKTYLLLENIEYEQGISVIFNPQKEDTLLKEIKNFVVAKGLQVCYFPSIDRVSVLIFSPRPKEINSYLTQYVEKRCHSAIHIGISNIFLSLEEIPQALLQASQAFTYATHTGTQVVNFSFEIEEQTILAYEKRKETEKLLFSFIHQGKREESRRIVHELEDMLFATYGSQTEEKLLDEMYELVLVISHSISNEIPNLQYTPVQRTSLLELERYLMDFIDYVCSTISNNKKNKYYTMFKSVCEFIETHYQEQLSLELLAEKTKLTPSYFSRLFTEYCECSFISYLTNVRIEAAKKHLQIGTKVHQVAILVGYQDYSYFSRVFRHIVKISPKEYQKNNERKY